jgi:hypothetical protein
LQAEHHPTESRARRLRNKSCFDFEVILDRSPPSPPNDKSP